MFNGPTSTPPPPPRPTSASYNATGSVFAGGVRAPLAGGPPPRSSSHNQQQHQLQQKPKANIYDQYTSQGSVSSASAGAPPPPQGFSRQPPQQRASPYDFNALAHSAAPHAAASPSPSSSHHHQQQQSIPTQDVGATSHVPPPAQGPPPPTPPRPMGGTISSHNNTNNTSVQSNVNSSSSSLPPTVVPEGRTAAAAFPPPPPPPQPWQQQQPQRQSSIVAGQTAPALLPVEKTRPQRTNSPFSTRVSGNVLRPAGSRPRTPRGASCDDAENASAATTAAASSVIPPRGGTSAGHVPPPAGKDPSQRVSLHGVSTGPSAQERLEAAKRESKPLSLPSHLALAAAGKPAGQQQQAAAPHHASAGPSSLSSAAAGTMRTGSGSRAREQFSQLLKRDVPSFLRMDSISASKTARPLSSPSAQRQGSTGVAVAGSSTGAPTPGISRGEGLLQLALRRYSNGSSAAQPSPHHYHHDNNNNYNVNSNSNHHQKQQQEEEEEHTSASAKANLHSTGAAASTQETRSFVAKTVSMANEQPQSQQQQQRQQHCHHALDREDTNTLQGNPITPPSIPLAVSGLPATRRVVDVMPLAISNPLSGSACGASDLSSAEPLHEGGGGGDIGTGTHDKASTSSMSPTSFYYSGCSGAYSYSMQGNGPDGGANSTGEGEVELLSNPSNPNSLAGEVDITSMNMERLRHCASARSGAMAPWPGSHSESAFGAAEEEQPLSENVEEVPGGPLLTDDTTSEAPPSNPFSSLETPEELFFAQQATNTFIEGPQQQPAEDPERDRNGGEEGELAAGVFGSGTAPSRHPPIPVVNPDVRSSNGEADAAENPFAEATPKPCEQAQNNSSELTEAAAARNVGPHVDSETAPLLLSHMLPPLPLSALHGSSGNGGTRPGKVNPAGVTQLPSDRLTPRTLSSAHRYSASPYERTDETGDEPSPVPRPPHTQSMGMTGVSNNSEFNTPAVQRLDLHHQQEEAKEEHKGEWQGQGEDDNDDDGILFGGAGNENTIAFATEEEEAEAPAESAKREGEGESLERVEEPAGLFREAATPTPAQSNHLAASTAAGSVFSDTSSNPFAALDSKSVLSQLQRGEVGFSIGNAPVVSSIGASDDQTEDDVDILARAPLVNPFARTPASEAPFRQLHGKINTNQRKKRPFAPCFALFSPTGNGIIACFNQPTNNAAFCTCTEEPYQQQLQKQRQRGGVVRSHIATCSAVSAMLSEESRTSAAPALHPLPPSGSITMQNASPSPAPWVKGTLVGKHYVLLLTRIASTSEVLAPTAAACDPRVLISVSEAFRDDASLRGPLPSLLVLLVRDAAHRFSRGELGEPFLWSNGGKQVLLDLLLEEDEDDVEEEEEEGITAKERENTGEKKKKREAIASEKERQSRSDDKQRGCSPCNPTFAAATATRATTGGTSLDHTTVSPAASAEEALAEVQALVSRGDRETAVAVALRHKLYTHAILIAMMCSTKEAYMLSVKAVVEQELLCTSPLAHAYCLFNELPLPPFAPERDSPAEPLEEGKQRGEEEDDVEDNHAKRQRQQRQRQQHAEAHRTSLKENWRLHAQTLVANFTRKTGEGLLALGDELQRAGLVEQAHSCFLIALLSPLGLPPVSVTTPAKPEQLALAAQLRERFGVVGGFYHPVDSCRASFLSPASTLLTDIAQNAVALAMAAATAQAGEAGEAAAAAGVEKRYGIPARPPRYAAAFRFMQGLWLRECGMAAEARALLNALVGCGAVPALYIAPDQGGEPMMPPPGPPRTLNELVFLFGQIPLELGTSATADKHATDQGRDELHHQQPPLAPPDGPPSKQLPSPQPPQNLQPPRQQQQQQVPTGTPQRMPPPPPQQPPRKQQQPLQRMPLPMSSGGFCAGGSSQGGLPSVVPPPPLAGRPDSGPSLPPPPLPAQDAQPSPASQQLTPPTSQALAPPASETAQGRQLQPPPAMRQRAQSRTPGAEKEADKQKEKTRRSRSVEAFLRFFRRGKSEDADDGKKEEEAKPMILNTAAAPKFDKATGRWLFEETEEEKAQASMVKAGPPKMPPGGGGGAAAAGGPKKMMPPPPGVAPSATGSGVIRRGPVNMGRPQYVDMFNS